MSILHLKTFLVGGTKYLMTHNTEDDSRSVFEADTHAQRFHIDSSLIVTDQYGRRLGSGRNMEHWCFMEPGGTVFHTGCDDLQEAEIEFVKHLLERESVV